MDDHDEVHGDNDNIDKLRCRIASYDDDDDDDVDGDDGDYVVDEVNTVRNDVHWAADDRSCLYGRKI